jgi:PD-(D/E)XK endonuclease
MRKLQKNPGKRYMLNDGVGRSNAKRRGEAAEAAFLARASNLGFSVAKPWGDSDRYDFLIDSGQGFLRVQVKSTTCLVGRAYNVMLGHTVTGTYSKANIDFVVAYIVPASLWYVLPVEIIAGHQLLSLRPGRESKYERYREAWCLLASARRLRGWRDIPALCRCKEISQRCAICPRQPCGADTPVRRF